MINQKAHHFVNKAPRFASVHRPRWSLDVREILDAVQEHLWREPSSYSAGISLLKNQFAPDKVAEERRSRCEADAKLHALREDQFKLEKWGDKVLEYFSRAAHERNCDLPMRNATAAEVQEIRLLAETGDQAGATAYLEELHQKLLGTPLAPDLLNHLKRMRTPEQRIRRKERLKAKKYNKHLKTLVPPTRPGCLTKAVRELCRNTPMRSVDEHQAILVLAALMGTKDDLPCLAEFGNWEGRMLAFNALFAAVDAKKDRPERQLFETWEQLVRDAHRALGIGSEPPTSTDQERSPSVGSISSHQAEIHRALSGKNRSEIQMGISIVEWLKKEGRPHRAEAIAKRCLSLETANSQVRDVLSKLKQAQVLTTITKKDALVKGGCGYALKNVTDYQ